jgi:hypothetical protein
MSQTTPTLTSEYPHIAHLTESERHSLLMVECRRLVLEILEERSAPAGLSELATAVARREDDCDPSSDETLQKVEITLHHTHLPKMDDLGVVSYDPDRHQVTF